MVRKDNRVSFRKESNPRCEKRTFEDLLKKKTDLVDHSSWTDAKKPFIEFVSRKHATAAVRANQGADFAVASIRFHSLSEASAQQDVVLTGQLINARKECFDKLLQWFWTGHGEQFGGLIDMMSHGEASGMDDDPAQIAMATLSRWAMTIMDGGISMDDWLNEGVEILTGECELALGQCEAQVRAVVPRCAQSSRVLRLRISVPLRDFDTT